MKNNANVNDIFQNDNNSKNKTKTILLLSIVAIILIAIFLIIVWVMTRENSIQTMGNIDNTNTKILNQNPNDTKIPIPYAHNAEDVASQPANNPLDSNNQLGLNDTSMQPLSTTPPLGVDSQNNTLPNLTPITDVLPKQPTSSNNNELDYEKDQRFQTNYKALEQEHNAKNVQSSPDKSVKTAEKVITPLPPKEIKQAPDPTKPQQKNTKETKPATTEKKVEQKDTKATNDKKDNAKNNTKETPKVANNQANNNQANQAKPKSDTASADSKVIQRPVKPVDKNQGANATQGYYIQVGSFAQKSKIDPVFLNKISKYPYRTKTEVKDNVTQIKYLIGPYSTRTEATRYLQNIKTEINHGAFLAPVEIK